MNERRAARFVHNVEYKELRTVQREEYDALRSVINRHCLALVLTEKDWKAYIKSLKGEIRKLNEALGVRNLYRIVDGSCVVNIYRKKYSQKPVSITYGYLFEFFDADKGFQPIYRLKGYTEQNTLTPCYITNEKVMTEEMRKRERERVVNNVLDELIRKVNNEQQ